MKIKILFESPDIIILDKDAPLAVHGGLTLEGKPTLLSLLKDYLLEKEGKVPEFITPAHRIDLNTRGPVIFARNIETAKVLVSVFTRGEVLKTYLVLLEGKLEKNVFLEADVVKSSHRRSRIRNLKVIENEFPTRKAWLSAKDQSSQTISGTLLVPVENHRDSVLCRAEIWTGRHHQIRAVCEAYGHPVCGDTKYNHHPAHHNKRWTNPAYPSGQMLICKNLEIPSLGILVESGFNLEMGSIDSSMPEIF